MRDIFFLVALFVIIGYLLFRISRRGISSKYDRKLETPWSKLNDGVDPTL
jgi:hypothetical protein